MKQSHKQEEQKAEEIGWRAKALEMLPEMAEEIRDAWDAIDLWMKINSEFGVTYAPESDFVRRVYAYADWCLWQEQKPEDSDGNNLVTAVAIYFYENIPIHQASRDDMPNWFTRDEIIEMKGIFGYLLSDKEFDELLALFPEPPPPIPTRKRKRRRVKIA